MEVVLKLLLLIELLFLVTVVFGVLGILGHVVRWVIKAWSGTPDDPDS